MKKEYFKANSNKSKEDTQEEVTNRSKNIGKVIEGKAVKVQKSGMGKMVEAILPEGGVTEIKNHILMDVVIPTIKKIISDTVETVLYGATGVSSRKAPRNTSRPSYVPYYNDYERNAGGPAARGNDPYHTGVRRTSGYDFGDVELSSRGEALNVIAHMRDIIDEYECVSVGDFYEMVDLAARHTDWDYGWVDIEGAKIVQLRHGGYTLKLPRPRKLPAAILG